MNKKVIWLIIGLMSAAVIGVVALQADLILTAIHANEDSFDKNVQNALNAVAKKVEETAQKEDILLVANGYSVDYMPIPESVVTPNKGGELGGMSIPIAAGSLDDRLLAEFYSPKTLCAECSKKHGKEIKNVSYNLLNTHSPIEDRIDPFRLGLVLAKELENHAIKTDYEFGVFSADKDQYIIYNAEYTDENEVVLASSQEWFFNLESTEYEVPLFEEGTGQIAGWLKVFFPEKSNVLWSNLLPSFIGTFLFAGMILICFGYTIWIIFHQKRVSEMKTDFINNMTHEFKTPIATISLAADSITSNRIAGDPSKVQRFAGIIKQENKRMNNQVEKVLQMAQIDRKEFQLRLTEIDLHEVIRRAVENIGLQVEQRDGKAHSDLQASTYQIQGDLTHVSNIINNLLDNANKYSPETPEINVATRNVKNGVEVIISDKGMGMTKEAKKHIFDKFYRVHTGDVHDVKGFGLGLSYVKALMMAHKGSIEVVSELGEGSQFILTFPFDGGHENGGVMMG